MPFLLREIKIFRHADYRLQIQIITLSPSLYVCGLWFRGSSCGIGDCILTELGIPYLSNYAISIFPLFLVLDWNVLVILLVLFSGWSFSSTFLPILERKKYGFHKGFNLYLVSFPFKNNSHPNTHNFSISALESLHLLLSFHFSSIAIIAIALMMYFLSLWLWLGVAFTLLESDVFNGHILSFNH